MDLNTWLDTRRLVVCVGSGGVGKTTVAASIALWGAVRGRRVIVLTIDPARRLANSLGLQAFGNEAVPIDLSELPGESGELWAMMLDSRSTFDGLICRLAADPERRERILKNKVYRYMSDTLAGSQDYMATERLHDLAVGDTYDLIVLDTPPVKNALDFLESPGRVVHFLDEKILQWFMSSHEGRHHFGPSAVIWKLLQVIFGRQFLEDLAVFFEDFRGLYEGFRRRHQAVSDLLRSEEASFLTVCAPTNSSVDVGRFFGEALKDRGLHQAGIIVNQVHRCKRDAHDANAVLGELAAKVGEDLDPAVVRSVLARLGMAHRRLHHLATAEAQITADLRLQQTLSPVFYQEVPRLESEVHDVQGLLLVAQQIFQGETSAGG